MARHKDEDEIRESSSPTCYLATTDPAYSGLPAPKAADGKSAKTSLPPQERAPATDKTEDTATETSRDDEPA